MRNCLLALAFMFFAVPAMAETITVKTPNERFLVIDVIRRTNSNIYTVLDTQTGKVSYRHLLLPRRKIVVSTRTWDPYAGRYRELIGYDDRSMPVYRDGDHSLVVYWITDKTDSSNWDNGDRPDNGRSTGDRPDNGWSSGERQNDRRVK